MSIALVLIAPGLLASPPEKLFAAHALSSLARYAGRVDVGQNGIAAALFAALDIPASTAVAPLAFLGAGGDPADDYVLCADPVHLVTRGDTLLLAQTIDDLSPADAQTLIHLLDRHFAEDRLRFEALRPDAWFARQRARADIATTPPDAARGRGMIASLPRGGEGGQWKRWQNEIQMLLHEHPVNLVREAEGKPAANAVWFSGGGVLSDIHRLPATTVTAPSTRLGDLALGIARHRAREAPRLHDDLRHAVARASEHRDRPSFVLAILPRAEDDPAAVDASWIAPALALLEARRVDALKLVADGNGVAATWSLGRPTWRQRFAARFARGAFSVPSPPDA